MQRSTAAPALLALALSAAALACQPATDEAVPTPAVDTTAIMATLDSMRAAFEEAVEAGDFETQAGFYATDAILSQPGRPAVEGRAAIRAELEATTPPGASLEIEPMELRILGPDWLYELGTGTLSFTPEGADQAVQAKSTYLAAFHRTEEGWRIQVESLSAQGPQGM